MATWEASQCLVLQPRYHDGHEGAWPGMTTPPLRSQVGRRTGLKLRNWSQGSKREGRHLPHPHWGPGALSQSERVDLRSSTLDWIMVKIPVQLQWHCACGGSSVKESPTYLGLGRGKFITCFPQAFTANSFLYTKKFHTEFQTLPLRPWK